MSGHKRVVLGILAGLALFALVAGTSLAEVPKKINYQMRIADTDTGEPLPGSHSVTFRIYDAEFGGSSIWGETRSVTADTAGVVSVVLGSISPIDISLDGPRWLQVEVDTEVLTPRRELVSVPYALSAEMTAQAANADSLGGMAASSFVQDGHSLDADDGNPVDAVYVHASGRVGIGTTSPDYELHVYGDGDNGTELVIENTDSGNQGWQGLRFEDESGYEMGIQARESDDPHYPSQMRFYNTRFEGDIRFAIEGSDRVIIDHDGRVGIRTVSPAQELHVNGEIQAKSLYLGDSMFNGGLWMYKGGVNDPLVRITTDWIGGRIESEDTSGGDFAELGPDGSDGGGGYFHVRRNDTSYGLVVDGNYLDTESTRMSLHGDGSNAYFDMSQIENQSVILPHKSVSSYETLEEPGVASVTAHDTSPTALAMQNGFNTLASRTIYTPADGYVLAIGSAQPTINHSGGTHSQAEFGVSDVSGAFPGNQDCLLRIPSQNVSAVYTFPVTVHGLFEVGSAGSHTFYFLGNEVSGTFTANDVQFTLVYFASGHGSVDPTFADGSQADFSVESEGTFFSKEEEIARERLDAERDHRERVERELAEMKAQIEALQREIEANPNNESR